MAKKLGKLASRYARALLRSVEKQQGSEGDPTPGQRAAAELCALADGWEAEAELSQSLLSPVFNKDQRRSALMALLNSWKCSELTQRFVVLLFDRNRLAALPEIAAAFRALADAAAGVQRVRIYTARPVTREEQAELHGILADAIEGKPEFSWFVDDSLLGGVVVEYGGRVIDGSLRGRLRRVERALVAPGA